MKKEDAHWEKLYFFFFFFEKKCSAHLVNGLTKSSCVDHEQQSHTSRRNFPFIIPHQWELILTPTLFHFHPTKSQIHSQPSVLQLKQNLHLPLFSIFLLSWSLLVITLKHASMRFVCILVGYNCIWCLHVYEEEKVFTLVETDNSHAYFKTDSIATINLHEN